MADDKKKKKNFSVGGLGGKSTTGAAGEWDVVGKNLDKANPWLDEKADEFFKKEEDYLQEGYDNWNDLEAPDLQQIDFDNEEWLSDYNPDAFVNPGADVSYQDVDTRLADLSTVGRSEMDNINVDPRLVDTQMGSLAALEDLASNGGMTIQDEANLSRIRNDAASADKGRRDAILQNMEARGMGGSGMELLAQLQSSQVATDRNAQEGLDVAGMAQQRALDALMQGGNLAGSIRGQEFGEGAAKAGANDAIAKFNAQNANQNSQFNTGAQNNMATFNATNKLNTDMSNRDTNFEANKINTGYANDASKYNHAGKQTTANNNVAINNDGKMYNESTLPQNQFNNNVTLTKGQTAQSDKLADVYGAKGNKQADENEKRKKTVVETAGKIMAMSDERQKKDVSKISSEEINEFLSAVSPKKFKYKDDSKSGTAGGDRVGFMAQDVENTSLGKRLITEKDGVKMFDKDNLDGIILAALANMKGKK